MVSFLYHVDMEFNSIKDVYYVRYLTFCFRTGKVRAEVIKIIGRLLMTMAARARFMTPVLSKTSSMN